MKKKYTKRVLVCLLALTVALAFTPLTAFANGGGDKATAVELEAGDSDTFTDETPVDFWYYKMNLSAPSKVVVTASLNEPL